MKKLFSSAFGVLSAVLCVFVLGFSACGKTEQEPWTWPYPDTAMFTGDEEYTDRWGWPDAAEQTYENVIAYMEQEVYPTDADILVAYVRNKNPGKGFYCWQYPLVEKLENGQWVQLDYRFESLFTTLGWGYVAHNPPKEDEEYEVQKKYWPEDVAGGVLPGEYRMVIFAGPKILYVPFQFVTPEEYAEKYAAEYHSAESRQSE